MTRLTIQDPTTPIRRRRVVTARRALIAAGVLLLALAGTWFIVLPLVLQKVVHDALHDAGVREQVHFNVASATPWGSRLIDVAAGSAVTIGRVDLNYSPADLWQGRINAIRLTAARIKLDVTDGQIDLKPITSLVSFSRTAQAKPPTKSPAATNRTTTRPSRGLPLELFSFRDSTLTFVTPARTVDIPVSGSMTQDAEHRLKLRLDAGEEQSLLLAAEVDPVAKSATFQGGAHAGQTLSVVRSIWPSADVAVAGRLLLNGSANWAKGLAGRATVQITQNDLEANSSEHKLQLSGGVLEIDITGPANKRRVRLGARDVVLTWTDVFRVEGAGGEIVLTQLTPPITLPGQVLTAEKLTIGDMEFTNGELELEVSEGETMLINETRWNWLGGEARASGVRVGPKTPLRATLQITNVELKDVLAAYSSDKLAGEGKLSGTLPISIENGRVTIGNGQLTSLAGGQLRIKDREMVEQVARQVGASEQVKRNITEAFQDFVYDSLSARFIDRPEGLLTRIRFGGHGRTGSRQEMTFDLRITGLEELLNSYLRIQSALSAARQRAEEGSRP